MAAPTPGNMDSCDPKCKCPSGPYADQAYLCDDPCAGQSGECTFSCEKGCDCDDGCYDEAVTAVVTYTKVQYQSDKFSCATNVCSVNCSDRGDFRECGISSSTVNINVSAGQCIVATSTTWADSVGEPQEICGSTPGAWLEYYKSYSIYLCPEGADPGQGECGIPVFSLSSSGCESGFLLDIDVDVS